MTSRIPDKGRVMGRSYGLYANAHRGNVWKTDRVPAILGMVEEEVPTISASLGAELDLQASPLRSPAVLDRFRAPFYTRS